MVYNAYTSDEEKHLIEYLAVKTPEVRGRSGNKIYQELINDRDKWPWGKYHTWQSWRDHYVKNQRIMNKKIRIYQKKHGITAESRGNEGEGKEDTGDRSAHRDLLVKEEEESSSLGEEELIDKKRLRKTPSDSSMNTKKRQKTAERSNDPHNDEKEVAFALDTMKNGHGAVIPTAPVLVLVPGETSESLQGTCIDSQCRATHDTEDTKEREEVGQMLVDGEETKDTLLDEKPSQQAGPSMTRPFSSIARKVPSSSRSTDSPDSLFDADSDVLVPDSEEELSIIPSGSIRRRRRQQEDFFQSEPEDLNTQGAMGIYRARIRRQPPYLKEGPFKTTFSGAAMKASEKIEDEDSDGAKSTSSWPPIRRKSPTSDSLKDQNKQADKHGRKAKLGHHEDATAGGERTLSDYTGLVQHEHHHQLRATPSHDTLPPASRHSSPLNRHPKGKRSYTPHGNGKRNTPQMKGAGYRSSSRSTHIRRTHIDDLAPDANKDVSVAKSPTEGDIGSSDHGRHVDLLKERRKEPLRRPTADSIASRSASTSTGYSASHGSRQSPLSLQLSTQDQSLVTSLGIQQAITMMSRNHGFTEDVVSKILQTVNSIPKADEVLRRMRMKAEEEAEKQLTSDPPQAQCSPPSRKHRRSTEAIQKLEIHATSDDEQVSDYSPPPRTRAGQFSRLVEQGRQVEAYAREGRRASGVMSPLKQASNNSNATDHSVSPPLSSPNKLWKPKPKAVKDGIFLECDLQQKHMEDISELRDAHAAMAGGLQKTEGKLGPRRALRRFQQTAAVLGQILADHQTLT